MTCSHKICLWTGLTALAFAGFATASSTAATLTWDADANGTASDGSGTWLNANQWLDGGVPATWNNATPDDAIIGVGGNAGTLDLTGGVTANDVTFNSFNNTYNMANGILTVNGTLTLGAGSGIVNFQATSGFAGTGNVVINGTYPPVKDAGTQLSFWQLDNVGNTFNGTYNVQNGILFTQGDGQTVNANSTIILNGASGSTNGATFESRWGGTMSRGLGTGAGQIQVTGGRSGFTGQGTNGFTIRIGGVAGSTVTWGDPNFNPDELILQSPNANTNGVITFDNTLDLNGADRTISVEKRTDYAWDQTTVNNASHTGGARMARSIVNNTGTGGLIKEGVGQLYMDAAMTYNGNTVVNGGILTYGQAAGMATTGTTAFNNGTEVWVEVGNANEFDDAGTGAGTINGLLNGVGNGGATVNYNGNVDVVVILTQNGQNLNLDLSDLGGGGTTTNLAIIERDFTLSGNNTFSGTLKVSKRGGTARTMTLGSSTALQGANVILDTSGSTVMNLNGFNATIGKLTTGSNSGGARGQVTGNGTLTITDGVFSDDHNNGGGGIFTQFLDLNGTEQVFEVRDASFAANVGDFLITSVIQNGSLTMTGLETNASLRLEGVNTYTGDTTVTAGILSINNAYLADTSSVYLTSGARFDLDFIGTDVIGELYLGGVAQGPGEYDASTDPTFFTGTGSLIVVPEPSTLAILGAGVALLGVRVARRRRVKG